MQKYVSLLNAIAHPAEYVGSSEQLPSVEVNDNLLCIRDTFKIVSSYTGTCYCNDVHSTAILVQDE